MDPADVAARQKSRRFGTVHWLVLVFVAIYAYDFVTEGFQADDALKLAGVSTIMIALFVGGPGMVDSRWRVPWREADARLRSGEVLAWVGTALALAGVVYPMLG